MALPSDLNIFFVFLIRDDGCSLNLDVSQMPVTADHPVEGITVYAEEGEGPSLVRQSSIVVYMVSFLTELFDLDAILSRQICPTFSNFKFNCTDSVSAIVGPVYLQCERILKAGLFC